MTNTNVLKPTKCQSSCVFSTISVYCFDCPGLMCQNCNKLMHRDKKHETMLFVNNNLQWNDKKLITNLFDDRNLGLKVFTEVNRAVEVHREKIPDPPIVPGGTGGWKCLECTFINDISNNKCGMCCLYRKIVDFSGEYESKVGKYMERVNSLFIQLDGVSNAPFENAASIYQSVGGGNANFMQWYQHTYVGDRDVSVFNDVIDSVHHNIAMDQLYEQYAKIVKEKNQCLHKILPKLAITDTACMTASFVKTNDINRKVVIPNDMLNKEIKIEDLWKVISQKGPYTDRQVRMLMTELHLPQPDNVRFLRLIMDHPELGPYLRQNCPNGSVKLEHVRQACLDNILLDDAVNFLKKECCLCLEDFPMPQMQPLIICAHEFCKSCFKSWLEENIRQRYPCKWGCPLCPSESYEYADKTLHYSNLREFLLNNNGTNDVFGIFDEKLLNERLMGSELFHWCANEQCVNGFEAEGLNMKVQCPSCNTHMCVKCNREWKPQHENTTCEEFELWMLRNDPNLAKVLNDIGIECPNCKMRYALAPGGCLHFECKKCSWVFCGGCYEEFTSKCKVPGCSLGTAFHGHHPRNCLYYMRDYTPPELENMLKAVDYPKLKDKPSKKCPFIVADEKMANKVCDDVVYGTSGLCERHYKEYLVQFINRLKIDPAVVAKSAALNLMLFQGLKKQLTKANGESEDAFEKRLRNEVQQQCKLYIPNQVVPA